MKTFYVCSYGGCGSTMLTNALNTYGNVEHIHSKYPPDKLEYVGSNGGGNGYNEWFNGIRIPDDKLREYYVIYIYRNPIKSILSRFFYKAHLDHIQVDNEITINDIINSSRDLYGIRQFYTNYTQPNENRNYKIYCIKYQDLFEKQDEISEILGIGKLNLIKKETDRGSLEMLYREPLHKIYKELIDTMNKNPFLFIS